MWVKQSIFSLTNDSNTDKIIITNSWVLLIKTGYCKCGGGRGRCDRVSYNGCIAVWLELFCNKKITHEFLTGLFISFTLLSLLS